MLKHANPTNHQIQKNREIKNNMGRFSRYFLFWLLAISTLYGCVTNRTAKNETKSSTVKDLSSSISTTKKVCPIPPLNHEKIPGYRPGGVDPSLSSKALEFISPTLEGNPTFYSSILQQPVKFCGMAKENIVKIKLFASGIYIYEKRYPNPEKPELSLGEAKVKNGIWFFSYDFREVGSRDIIAKGYDSKGTLIATTSQISIFLSDVNPR